MILTIPHARVTWFRKALPVCVVAALSVTACVVASIVWKYGERAKASDVEVPTNVAVVTVMIYFLANLFLAEWYSDTFWRSGRTTRLKQLALLPIWSLMMLLVSGFVISAIYFLGADQDRFDGMYLSLRAFAIFVFFAGIGVVSAIYWLVAGWALSKILTWMLPGSHRPDTASPNSGI